MQSQKYPNKAILIPNLRIFIFAQKFTFWNIQVHWLQIIFSNLNLGTPQIKQIWSQFKIFFVLDDTLQLNNFERVGFKDDNSFLKLMSKTTQTMRFWSQIQGL